MNRITPLDLHPIQLNMHGATILSSPSLPVLAPPSIHQPTFASHAHANAPMHTHTHTRTHSTHTTPHFLSSVHLDLDPIPWPPPPHATHATTLSASANASWSCLALFNEHFDDRAHLYSSTIFPFCSSNLQLRQSYLAIKAFASLASLLKTNRA